MHHYPSTSCIKTSHFKGVGYWHYWNPLKHIRHYITWIFPAKVTITNNDLNILVRVDPLLMSINKIYSHFKYRATWPTKIYIWFAFGGNVSKYTWRIIINSLFSTVNISMANVLYGTAMLLYCQCNDCIIMFNSLKLDDAYTHKQTGPWLVRIMAHSLIGAKLISKPMLAYCQSGP